jgi:group I intron endonuclease
MWLYKLTNKVNGKSYVGTSVNPISNRMSRHRYSARNGWDQTMPITHAIAKYGFSAFIVKCLGKAKSHSELMKMEVRAIRRYKTRVPNGYNVTAGGMGGIGRPMSAKTRAIFLKARIGKRAWNFGIKTGPLSKEHRKKLSKSHMGHKAWNLGIPHSPEHIKKLRGRKPWNFGKKTGPISKKHKKEISATMKKVRALQFWSTKKGD